MDIHEVAEMLNGRQYGQEITKEEALKAELNKLVVVFGASDDLMELRGAIDDEVDCYEGGEIFLDENGIFEECESDCKYSQLAKEKYRVIKAVWCNMDHFAWAYETDIPHTTFEIYEDDEPYCQGIVFDLKNLENKEEK